MQQLSYYTIDELQALGLKSYGKNIRISRFARLYGVENIELGSHVRIDDFCVVSGNVKMGSFVHISAGAMIFAGSSSVMIDDFTAISGGARVYAVTEDLRSGLLTNPTVPPNLRRVLNDEVRIGKHTVVSALSTLLPGAYLAEGAVLGANSMLAAKTEPWKIYAGTPAKIVGTRPEIPKELEEEAFRAVGINRE